MLNSLLTLFLAFAANAPSFERPHGQKMLVQYFIYNAGLHGLVVQEKQEDSIWKEMQKIRIFFKKEEFLTNQFNFQCETKEKEYVYAIASKKKASRKKPFKPSRGWVVDMESNSLILVPNPSLVKCKWLTSSKVKYPF